ncbi:hypothetical protein SCP_1200330 [Sparassis crispa]|uniref:Uncharacterized protein n=1 Tax=Sparassis crispa TaxID=139825 RepID=A0A401H070_9APHY|nr:hypothetical protein SCP_1200330 [Sparassis crispa]GBE87808.1 hypothetical protein SCP_1200330 [Sparassis crispa]
MVCPPRTWSWTLTSSHQPLFQLSSVFSPENIVMSSLDRPSLESAKISVRAVLTSHNQLLGNHRLLSGAESAGYSRDTASMIAASIVLSVLDLRQWIHCDRLYELKARPQGVEYNFRGTHIVYS